MKYRWVKQPITQASIEKLLGKKIERFTIGSLDTEIEDTTETGIEVEFMSELVPEELEKLDMLFPELKRVVKEK